MNHVGSLARGAGNQPPGLTNSTTGPDRRALSRRFTRAPSSQAVTGPCSIPCAAYCLGTLTQVPFFVGHFGDPRDHYPGQLAVERGMRFVCVQPMLTSWSRWTEDPTFDKTDERDPVLMPA